MGRVLNNIWVAEKERRDQIELCYQGTDVVDFASVNHAFWLGLLMVKVDRTREWPEVAPPHALQPQGRVGGAYFLLNSFCIWELQIPPTVSPPSNCPHPLSLLVPLS